MTAIHFPFNLQKYRKARNLSQEDLAEKLQVSRQAVAKWEKGANYPDILNLTLLADIFGVTVDALIYGNECTETAGTLPAFPLSSQKLAEFLLSAKKNSYAGNGTEEKQPCRPLAHDFIYEDEDFLYLDTYLGGTAFSGEEAVWEKQQDKRIPIWSMNYAGRILADGFNSRFLKEALSHVQKEAPFRGPELYRKGEYVYHCSQQGNMQWFQGREEIYYRNQKVYECEFHGWALA